MGTYLTKELIPVTPLSTTIDLLYTTPAGKTTIIKTILFANKGATDARVSMYLVPAGYDASESKKIFGEVLVSANTTTDVDTAIAVPANNKIFFTCSTLNAINVHLTGIEIG
jgi:hypothetical protein